MEEWVALYEEYKEWIFLALSIPVGIFVNLISPPINAYLKRQSSIAKEAKIREIIIRYLSAKNRHEHPFMGLRRGGDSSPIAIGLKEQGPFGIALGLYLVIRILLPYDSLLRTTLVIILGIPVYYSMAMTIRGMILQVEELEALFNFDRFKRKTIKRLKRLGCNPQDYGIE